MNKIKDTIQKDATQAAREELKYNMDEI